MKLLTYNIHHWEGTDRRVDVARVAKVVHTSGADVVALNEVFHPAIVEPDNQLLLETMARHLDMAYVFGETVLHAAAIGHHRGVAITEWVYERVKASHETRKLPARTVKWQAEPLQVWKVIE